MMQMYEAELLQEETDALEHHGIKGQKWGERRFQNPDGTYTELGKERRRVGYEDPDKKKDEKSKTDGKAETPDIKIGGKAYKDMTKKELRAAKKRARHNEAERRAKREFNRDKREAIENGDIAFISKNISKFTNDEIDESIKRYKKMQDVWNLDKANRKDADHYLDKAIHYLSKMDSLSKSMTNIYNNFTESGKKKEEKRSQKYLADQNYYKSLQEQWKADHPGSSNDSNKDKKDDKNANKGSKENVEKEKQNLKDLKSKDREEETKRDREARDEEAKRKREWEKEDREEKWKERERKQQEKWDREDERDREKEERRKEKEERRREKEQEKEERRREKEEERRREEAERREEERKEREDFADDLFKRTEAKRKEREEKEAREREERAAKEKQKLLPLFEDDDDYAWLDNIDFGSQNKKKFGGWFSKDKNKDKDNKNSKDDWRKTYDELEKQLNEMNNKYLNQMNSYYSNNNKFGSFQRNKSNRELPLNTTRDNQWRKQIEKSHDSRVIDKWVNEMTKKYETERNMDKKTAEKYAERYVDYWLERYDEDIAKSL